MYWDNAIRCGHVRINNNVVTNSYVIRNSDALLHRTHRSTANCNPSELLTVFHAFLLFRHEPPVFGNITYVGETEKYFAVCKPPSLPMHPCGAYRYNTLEYILKNDPLSETQPSLNLVHRLDRYDCFTALG